MLADFADEVVSSLASALAVFVRFLPLVLSFAWIANGGSCSGSVSSTAVFLATGGAVPSLDRAAVSGVEDEGGGGIVVSLSDGVDVPSSTVVGGATDRV